MSKEPILFFLFVVYLLLLISFRWDSDIYSPYHVYKKIYDGGRKMIELSPRQRITNIPPGNQYNQDSVVLITS